MISPHTPPGTKIVCINDKRAIAPIKKNSVYTVAEIVPVEKSPSEKHYRSFDYAADYGRCGSRGHGRNHLSTRAPRYFTRLQIVVVLVFFLFVDIDFAFTRR
jgi:hypothetical protein